MVNVAQQMPPSAPTGSEQAWALFDLVVRRRPSVAPRSTPLRHPSILKVQTNYRNLAIYLHDQELGLDAP